MNRFLILFLFVLLNLDCSSLWKKNIIKHYTVSIDPTFDVENQLLIKQVVNDWQEAVDNFITFEFVNDEVEFPTNQIVIVPTTSNQLNLDYESIRAASASNDNDYTKIVGICIYHNTSREIRIIFDISSEELFSQILKHELGHALGLEHSEENTVMCKDTGCASLNITCKDVKNFCKVWDCNASEMKICQK